MTNKTLRTLGTGGAIGDSDLFLTRQGSDTVDKSVTGNQIKAYSRGSFSALAPVSYNLTTGEFTLSGTKAQFDAACSDGNFLYVGDVTQYTDEMAQDAVGGMVNATLTYVDGTPSLGINLGNANTWTAAQWVTVSSGSSIAVDISKGGNNEALRVTKTSGSGNAVTISGGTLETNGDILMSGETASRIAIFDASKNIISADTATYPSLTELAYIKGVTSAVQTQLNAKAAAAFSTGFGITIDGGGSAITTGSKGFVIVPYAMTITGWTITGDVSGSVVVDIKRSTYSGFPTTSSIAGTEKPTLSSAQKNQDNTLSTWTTSLAAGDVIEFVVDSATTVARVNLTVNGTRA